MVLPTPATWALWQILFISAHKDGVSGLEVWRQASGRSGLGCGVLGRLTFANDGGTFLCNQCGEAMIMFPEAVVCSLECRR
jgi:hypothetical protein